MALLSCPGCKKTLTNEDALANSCVNCGYLFTPEEKRENRRNVRENLKTKAAPTNLGEYIERNPRYAFIYLFFFCGILSLLIWHFRDKVASAPPSSNFSRDTSTSSSQLELEAMNAGREAVKMYLMFPSEASFDMQLATSSDDLLDWTVTGNVKAKNAFGTTTVQCYLVTLKHSGGRWEPVSVTLQ